MKYTKPSTPRIVICESDIHSPRGEVRRPHELTADCVHPVRVHGSAEKRDEK